MGPEHRANAHHAKSLLPRNRQNEGAVRQDERQEDQGREGEPVERDRDEGRRRPGDEDGRERHGYDREGDRGIGAASHEARTSARLCNACGTTSRHGGGGVCGGCWGGPRGRRRRIVTMTALAITARNAMPLAM